MSAEGLKSIREAEKQAENMIAAAKGRGAEILEESHQTATSLISQAKKTAQSRYDSILVDARKSSETEATEMANNNMREVGQVKTKAESNRHAAAGFVVEALLPPPDK
jgi:V/A-type H+-transporting ATPase subunit G/H